MNIRVREKPDFSKFNNLAGGSKKGGITVAVLNGLDITVTMPQGRKSLRVMSKPLCPFYSYKNGHIGLDISVWTYRSPDLVPIYL